MGSNGFLNEFPRIPTETNGFQRIPTDSNFKIRLFKIRLFKIRLWVLPMDSLPKVRVSSMQVSFSFQWVRWWGTGCMKQKCVHGAQKTVTKARKRSPEDKKQVFLATPHLFLWIVSIFWMGIWDKSRHSPLISEFIPQIMWGFAPKWQQVITQK